MSNIVTIPSLHSGLFSNSGGIPPSRSSVGERDELESRDEVGAFVEGNVENKESSVSLGKTPLTENLLTNYKVDNSLLTVEGSLDTLFEVDVPVVEECCICYETIDPLKNNCVTECGHRFCFKCMVTSLMHDNNNCPCCRQSLVDEEDTVDEDSDAGSEDIEESVNGEEEEETECSIEELSERLTAAGFGIKDMLSMLLGRYEKGVTDLSIYELNKKFDDLIDDADNESLENEEMGQEDHSFPQNGVAVQV